MMKAVCWNGINDVRVENVPDPKITNPRDCIVKTSLMAICGSDLHLYGGFIPAMMKGDILGHEFMGEVVEVGPAVQNLKRGDRVVVPFADVGPVKVPERLSDEQVLFISDIFSTGYWAAENCDIHPGDTIAIFGCGPVGQMAIRSAYLLGAEKVIALDHFPERLKMAKEGGAEVINFEDIDIVDQLKEMTGGRGPDACIDAVGLESHGTGFDALFDRVEQRVRLENDRPIALRNAIQACRKSGTVVITGDYSGHIDKFPIGSVFNKGLTLKSGQANAHKYKQPLMQRVERGEIDPSFVITHRLSLDDAPRGYHIFKNKLEGCVKVVMTP
jgi:threonine dehydrogenase-like Zn-dependent dehydrogenase